MSEQLSNDTHTQNAALSGTFNDFVEQSVLSNGIKLVTQPYIRYPKTSFQITIEAGSFDDPDGKNGLAHYLEHVLLPTPMLHEAAERGGYIGAGTSGQNIRIHGEVDNTLENQEFLASTLRNILTRTLCPESYTRERRRILNEIGIFQDKEDSVHRKLLKHAFNGASPIGGDLGAHQDIENMSIDELEAFRNAWFVGPNITIALRGISDHARMKDLLEAQLASVPATTPPTHNAIMFQSIEHREESNRPHQLYFSLTYTPHLTDIKQHAIGLMASRYLGVIMEKHFLNNTGLTYHFDVHGWAITPDTGFFNIRGNLLPEDAQELMPDIARILAESSVSLDDDIFRQIQNMANDYLIEKINGNILPPPLIKNLVRGSDTSAQIPIALHDIDELYNHLKFFGRPISLIEEMTIYKDITKEDVLAYISELTKQRPALITYGNSQKLHRLNDFMTMLEAEKQKTQSPDFSPKTGIPTPM